MDQKRIEELRRKLDYIAKEGGTIGYIALNAYAMKPCTLLAEMAGAMNFARDLEEDEIELQFLAALTGRNIKDGPPDHQMVYDAVKDAIEKVKAAYQASLEAAVVSYVLFEDCDCKACSHRRQSEKAHLS